MDRRTLLAIGLSLLFFIGWQKFYIEPRVPKPKPGAAQISATGAAPGATTTAPNGTAVPVAAKPIDVKSYEVPVATGTAMIGDAGKFFTDWRLNQYRLSMDNSAPAVDLRSVTASDLTPSTGFNGQGELAFDAPELAYANNVQGTMTTTPNGATWKYEDANLKLERQYAFGADKSYVDLVLLAEFKTKAPKFAFVSLAAKSPEGDKEEVDRQFLALQGDSLERLHMTKFKPEDGKPESQRWQIPGNTRWIGAQSRYFLMTLVPEAPASYALAQATDHRTGKLNLVYPIAGNALRIPLKAYFGPKEMNLLRSVEPSLDLTIDFGWFTVLAYPILRVMKWINTFVHNWGLAIIILTILIKVLTFPLTYKGTKNMKKMAVLQPQIKALQEKHKDDKETLNREMITFMRTNGYNPVAGCLPIFIQMPVFFALYRVLYSSIELYQAPFMGWIHDLSHKDPYYITPVILTGVMWLQQKLTPNTATDPMQAKMLQWMPVFFGLMMLNLPAGLTIYMLVNALVSVIQQKWMNARFAVSMPAPGAPIVLPKA
jgi:YidC/Oxa1 family membrane protein insertase